MINLSIQLHGLRLNT